jgi:hypothetical protein
VNTYEDYRRAAILYWGEAGDFASAEFARLNREHFASSIPPMPVIIGLTAYGKCIGLTRGGTWLDSPRITLAPELFNGNHRTAPGPRMVSDVLVHEMAHAALMLRSEDPDHNSEPWCRLITELSPAVLGREISARPVLPRRVPNPDRASDPGAPKTVVIRKPEPGTMSQADLGHWPHSCRPGDYYLGGQPIPVPTH